MASLLPNTAVFIYAYVRKEALVSSCIEGAQSSFSDLCLDEVRCFVLDEDSRP
jgi:Fic family protein